MHFFLGLTGVTLVGMISFDRIVWWGLLSCLEELERSQFAQLYANFCCGIGMGGVIRLVNK